VSVYGIAQANGRAGADVLGDIRLWRSQLAADAVGPQIAAENGRLDITVTTWQPQDGKYLDDRVYFAGSAGPLPMVVAGPVPKEQRPGDPRIMVLGAVDVPYQIVGYARVLPRLGSDGALMDLAAAQSDIGLTKESISLEVWLAANAPDSV